MNILNIKIFYKRGKIETQSVKLNFILNTSRLLLGAFFILLTAPYITRILGVQNLGKVDYVNSVIMYFILFTGLGIPKLWNKRNSKSERK